MDIIYGTTNAYKVQNLYNIIKYNNFNEEIHVLTNRDIGFDKDIIEDGTTFEENSLIKAKAIKEYCDQNNIKDKIIITDDSGLCIDKLNGEPGIYTARYAGEHATQLENLNKVLTNLKDVTDIKDRTCHLVCVLTAIMPNGEVLNARGECNGTIALKYGKLGGLMFGPLFVPNGFDKPMGDMEEKEFASVHNHREIATKKILEKIEKVINK